MRCPICDKTFDPAASETAPFCSDRCRTIDLGRWLDESYAVPTESIPNSLDLHEENDPDRVSGGT
jgi:endogenous inhibitor of DNA gyrase (YacG/DUF329 family)